MDSSLETAVSPHEGVTPTTVLIAGADETAHARLIDILDERKHAVHSFERGTAAWACFQEIDPSLVFLAGITPDTLDLCRQIRSRPKGETTVVLAILYPYVREKLEAALRAGADECIMESIRQPERLHARIAFAEQQAQLKRRRQKAERELRASEAKARAIIETTVEGIIVSDQRGIVQSFNKAAEDIFGYRAEEVIGENVKLLMPSPYREEHDGYLQSYRETGEAKIIGIGREVVGRRSDGSTFPLQLSVSEVALGEERLFTGIVRDLSEKRRLEREILRISEQERRQIGEDLHEGLGQIISGIGILTEDLYHKLQQENSSWAQQAWKITEQLREADQYTDELVRGLVPVDVDAQGFVEALERLTGNVAELFNIECRLKVRGQPVIENPTVAFHLYRIVQEALNNAVKHSRASTVTTTLFAGTRKIRIRVKDNGTGFSSEDSETGIGLHIMSYRARIIGASLNVRSRPDGGTIMTCTLSNNGGSGQPPDTLP